MNPYTLYIFTQNLLTLNLMHIASRFKAYRVIFHRGEFIFGRVRRFEKVWQSLEKYKRIILLLRRRRLHYPGFEWSSTIWQLGHDSMKNWGLNFQDRGKRHLRRNFSLTIGACGSGQRVHLLLRRSDFESCWSLPYRNCLKRTEMNQKEAEKSRFIKHLMLRIKHSNCL